MTRLLDTGRLVVASHNPGKVREFANLLRRFDIEVLAAADLGLPEPEETGATFLENAGLKARAAAGAAGLPALADDSGLVVPALDGAPGLHSARWAGTPRDFSRAMARVWHQLEVRRVAPEDRHAYFLCALVLAWPDGHEDDFEGRIQGRLIWPVRGRHGFGYDPMFMPDGYACTFGEMEPDEKHAISHRARAFAKMIDACLNG